MLSTPNEKHTLGHQLLNLPLPKNIPTTSLNAQSVKARPVVIQGLDGEIIGQNRTKSYGI